MDFTAQPLTLLVTPPVLRVNGVDTAVTNHPAILTFQPSAVSQTLTGSYRHGGFSARAVLSPLSIYVEVSGGTAYRDTEELVSDTSLLLRDGSILPAVDLIFGFTGGGSHNTEDEYLSSADFTSQFGTCCGREPGRRRAGGRHQFPWNDHPPVPGQCPGTACLWGIEFSRLVWYTETIKSHSGAGRARPAENGGQRRMVPYAKRMEKMAFTANVVKGLFGSMTNPDIISFSGGSPAREALPVDTIRQLADEVLRTDTRGVEALQYGPIEGIRDLREVVVRELLAPKGIDCGVDNVRIITGGLEGINLACQA